MEGRPGTSRRSGKKAQFYANQQINVQINQNIWIKRTFHYRKKTVRRLEGEMKQLTRRKNKKAVAEAGIPARCTVEDDDEKLKRFQATRCVLNHG